MRVVDVVAHTFTHVAPVLTWLTPATWRGFAVLLKWMLMAPERLLTQNVASRRKQLR